MEAPVWFCGAPADPVADGLARRVAGLGLEVAASPSNADRAVVVLSPALAAADPAELRAWVSERGVDGQVLALAGGRADWDEEADRFASGQAGDAVPAALREAVRQRPFVIDVRGADEAKLDRCARRIAGAVSTTGPPDLVVVDAEPDPERDPTGKGRRRRRPIAIAAVVLGLSLVGALVFTLGQGGDDAKVTAPSSAVSTPTTGRIPPTTASIGSPTTGRPGSSTSGRPGSSTTVRPGSSTTVRPTTTVAPSSEGDSNLVSWIIIVVLASALAVTLVMLKRRPKAPPAPAAGPAPPATPAPPVPVGAAQVFISHDTEADGRVARELVEQLRRHQLEAWIAPESIPPGEPWVFAIEQGLVTSRAALVLVSPAALASGWVRREIQMIVDLEIDGRLHVVPVRVAPCDVPLLLTAYQWVDIGDFERAADSLARRFTPTAAPGPTGAG